MRKKHILLVGNSAWSMYNFRSNLMSRLVSEGYQVSVLSPLDSEFELKIKETGANFYPLDIRAKGTNPFHDLSLTLRIMRYIKQLKPDFAFFFTIKPNIYGGLAARFCRTPFVAVTTGLGYTFVVDNWVSKIARKLYTISFKAAQEVWFLNNDDKNDFIQYQILSEEKAFVLHGEGVDTTRFAVSSLPKEVSFLLMARMLWDKGVGEFVEAARIVKSKYPDVQFNLLGFLNVDNPSSIPVAQIEAWEKEGLIRFLGATPNVIPFIEASTSIVLPSYYREGVPMTLLEAASMGRIVITTDNVGCRETVIDEKTGFLCRVKDVAHLAEQMEKLLSMSYAEKQAMSLEARKMVEEKFDVNNVIHLYLKTIENVGKVS